MEGILDRTHHELTYGAAAALCPEVCMEESIGLVEGTNSGASPRSVPAGKCSAPFLHSEKENFDGTMARPALAFLFRRSRHRD